MQLDGRWEDEQTEAIVEATEARHTRSVASCDGVRTEGTDIFGTDQDRADFLVRLAEQGR